MDLKAEDIFIFWCWNDFILLILLQYTDAKSIIGRYEKYRVSRYTLDYIDQRQIWYILNDLKGLGTLNSNWVLGNRAWCVGLSVGSSVSFVCVF